MKKIFAGLLACWITLIPASAFADSTINALGAGATLGGTEQIPMFQSANPAVTTTPAAIATFVGSGALFPTYVSGLWYIPFSSTAATTSSGALAATTAFCTLGLIGGNPSVTIKTLAVRISTSGTTNIQLAIYNNNSTASGYNPGTLVIATANIINTAGAGNTANGAVTPTTVAAGWYWFCIQSNDTTFRNNTVGGTTGQWAQGASTAGSVTNLNATVSTSTGITSFGTWPSFVGATFANAGGSGPLVAFQIN